MLYSDRGPPFNLFFKSTVIFQKKSCHFSNFKMFDNSSTLYSETKISLLWCTRPSLRCQECPFQPNSSLRSSFSDSGPGTLLGALDGPFPMQLILHLVCFLGAPLPTWDTGLLMSAILCPLRSGKWNCRFPLKPNFKDLSGIFFFSSLSSPGVLNLWFAALFGSKYTVNSLCLLLCPSEPRRPVFSVIKWSHISLVVKSTDSENRRTFPSNYHPLSVLSFIGKTCWKRCQLLSHCHLNSNRALLPSLSHCFFGAVMSPCD